MSKPGTKLLSGKPRKFTSPARLKRWFSQSAPIGFVALSLRSYSPGLPKPPAPQRQTKERRSRRRPDLTEDSSARRLQECAFRWRGSPFSSVGYSGPLLRPQTAPSPSFRGDSRAADPLLFPLHTRARGFLRSGIRFCKRVFLRAAKRAPVSAQGPGGGGDGGKEKPLRARGTRSSSSCARKVGKKRRRELPLCRSRGCPRGAGVAPG